MAYEPEGQGAIPGGDTGAFWRLGLPKALSRYLPQSGVYAPRHRPHLMRTYL